MKRATAEYMLSVKMSSDRLLPPERRVESILRPVADRGGGLELVRHLAHEVGLVVECRDDRFPVDRVELVLRDADVARNLTVLEQLVWGPCGPGLAADPDEWDVNDQCPNSTAAWLTQECH